MNELPKEVSFPPAPYVAFVGLNAAANATHNQIWNTFAINRAVDRPPLYYKLTPEDYTFPQAKVKKAYDRYVPSGILKTNWLSKHLFEVPSVVVIFEESNLELLKDNETQSKCIENVNRVRKSLNGRQTKIILILLQSSSATLSDDSIHKEHAAKLCADCDINPKSLFVIPIDDPQLIFGYVQRIESVILDLSKNYYIAEVKSVRSHKDQLNKSTQIYLYIRHEFKFGFFHEIRQIYNTALSHYKNAYVSLMEIRTNQLNVFEVKTIATLLNYKICRLCFYLNIPMDAISHFRKHIDIFQNKFSSNQIDFEHFAWLSEQFFMFAELFEMAVNSFSLSPSSTQHPGVYYFESATYMSERRTAARSLAASATQVNMEEANFLNAITNFQNSQFVGQFVWSGDLTDSEKIRYAYLALQYRESQVDHTKLLINLYGNVLNQIRKFKKPRFMRYLMYLIGGEYYQLANYEEALTYFSNTLQFYREEKWNDIYFNIVQLAMNSAYRCTDLENFIRFGFEQMSNEKVNDRDKTDLLNCLNSLLNLQYAQLSENGSYVGKWTEVLDAFQHKEMLSEICILMDQEINFIDCKIAFSANQYFIGDKVNLTVALFSSLPLDISNVSIQLKLNNMFYDQFCTSPLITLKGKSLTKFNFEFKPVLKDIGNEIRVSELTLKYCKKQNVLFTWTQPKMNQIKFSTFEEQKNTELSTFTKFKPLLCTEIKDHQSKLNAHILMRNESGKIYLNEHIVLKLKAESCESFCVSNLQMSIKVMTTEGQLDSNFAWFTINDGRLVQSEEKLTIAEKLKPNESIETMFVIQLFTVGSKSIVFEINYDLLLENENKMQFILVHKRITQTINCVQPFKVRNAIRNLGNKDSANIRVAEPFRLTLDIGKLEGEDSTEVLSLTPYFNPKCDIISPLENEQWNPMEVSELSSLKQSYLLKCSTELPSPHSLGNFVLRWRCKENFWPDVPRELLTNESTFEFPMTSVINALVFVELRLPEVCHARSAIMARYLIHNRLDTDVTAEISMGTSDGFMLSGNKLIKVCIKANLFIEQTYILFPLVCGELELPQLGITLHLANQNPVQIDYVGQMLASTLKVLPQVRT